MRDEADASRGSRSRATTKSSEDYLEAILVIRRLRGSCRNVDIAERLGFAKASVTKALGNLARKGLAEVVGRDVRLDRRLAGTLPRPRHRQAPLLRAAARQRRA